MDYNNSIEPSVLRELLEYNHESGILTWKDRPLSFFPDKRSWGIWNTKYAGKQISSIVRGYYRVRIFGVLFFAHRVGWAIYHGSWPSDQLDHINGDRSDNRLPNLREVNNAINSRNSKRPANNTSGRVGVSFVKANGNWKAEICVDQKRMHIGCFPSFEDAVAAREDAERKFSFHPNHGRHL